jgi:hypothetical protein
VVEKFVYFVKIVIEAKWLVFSDVKVFRITVKSVSVGSHIFVKGVTFI